MSPILIIYLWGLLPTALVMGYAQWYSWYEGENIFLEDLIQRIILILCSWILVWFLAVAITVILLYKFFNSDPILLIKGKK